MTAALQLGVLVLLALAGLVVAAVRRPAEQAVALSVLGLLEALWFVLVQAPEVALSQVAVGAVLVPLLVLLALAKARHDAKVHGYEEEA